MAHIGEEHALRLARLKRRARRLLELDLGRLKGKLGSLARVDVAPRSDHLDGPARRVADQVLLVAYPAIGAILAAEAVLGEMLAVAKQLDLFGLDLGKIIRMDA